MKPVHQYVYVTKINRVMSNGESCTKNLRCDMIMDVGICYSSTLLEYKVSLLYWTAIPIVLHYSWLFRETISIKSAHYFLYTARHLTREIGNDSKQLKRFVTPMQ